MRFIFAAIVTACCLFGALPSANAGSYVGVGNYSGTPSPAVARLFAAYPNGGAGLIAAIRELLLSYPSLADDVAFLGTQGNSGQEQAASAGLSQAVTILVNRGDNGGASRITNAARSSGSTTIQTAVATAIAATVSFNTFQSNNPNKETNANCTTSTVSAAQPVTTCQ
ncbi:MAG: hypothetical protein GC182_12425 [Rhodopseudomonas sp.]|nr:hypothetical protein [Rhodopseudomonas sp.]